MQETVAPVAARPNDPWMFGATQTKGAASSTQKVDQKAELLGQEQEDVKFAPLGQEKEEKHRGEKNPNHITPDHIKADQKIPNLPFLTDDARIQPVPGIFEKYFPGITKCKACLDKHMWSPLSGPFAKMVQGSRFKIVSASVITLNFIFIVVQTDYKMNMTMDFRATNKKEEEHISVTIVGYAFNIFYLFELIANITAYGKVYFLGDDVGWNLFDTCIVTVAMVEVTVKVAGFKFVNTSFLRIIRFLRISRVLRMFSAMRMLKEIKIMVDTLSGSFSLFFYCSLLFILYLSLFAIFFVQGATAFLEEGKSVPEETLDHVKNHWASVAKAMRSLFMALTGGLDWNEYYDVIAQLGAIYNCLYLIFMLFSYIAFTNVMTSVFCEKAMRLARPTTQELTAARQDKEVLGAKELLHLLRAMMEDNDSNKISAADFDRFMEHPEVETYFELRGLCSSSAHRFFRLLCEVHQTEEVDFNTFVSACVKLDSGASSIDVNCLSVRQLKLQHSITAMQKTQHEDIKSILKAQQEQMQLLFTKLKTLDLPSYQARQCEMAGFNLAMEKMEYKPRLCL
jgi:hypothetical protein